CWVWFRYRAARRAVGPCRVVNAHTPRYDDGRGRCTPGALPAFPPRAGQARLRLEILATRRRTPAATLPQRARAEPRRPRMGALRRRRPRGARLTGRAARVPLRTRPRFARGLCRSVPLRHRARRGVFRRGARPGERANRAVARAARKGRVRHRHRPRARARRSRRHRAAERRALGAPPLARTAQQRARRRPDPRPYPTRPPAPREKPRARPRRARERAPRSPERAQPSVPPGHGHHARPSQNPPAPARADPPRSVGPARPDGRRERRRLRLLRPVPPRLPSRARMLSAPVLLRRPPRTNAARLPRLTNAARSGQSGEEAPAKPRPSPRCLSRAQRSDPRPPDEAGSEAPPRRRRNERYASPCETTPACRISWPRTMNTTISAMFVAWSAMRSRYLPMESRRVER